MDFNEETRLLLSKKIETPDIWVYIEWLHVLAISSWPLFHQTKLNTYIYFLSYVTFSLFSSQLARTFDPCHQITGQVRDLTSSLRLLPTELLIVEHLATIAIAIRGQVLEWKAKMKEWSLKGDKSKRTHKNNLLLHSHWPKSLDIKRTISYTPMHTSESKIKLINLFDGPTNKVQIFTLFIMTQTLSLFPPFSFAIPCSHFD